MTSHAVLDASALLALIQNEAGADFVEGALIQGASISAVNWAEVLSKTSDAGQDPEGFVSHLRSQGVLGEAREVVPCTEEDAELIAQLRPMSRSYGLSLADRACLALGIRTHLPVLTTDRIWLSLGLRVQIRAIR